MEDPPGTPYPLSPYHFHRDNVTRLPGVPTSEMGYNTATPGGNTISSAFPKYFADYCNLHR
ncbi:hypothetical protein C0J52_08329 [Blattella germanica]|nr:hypothetical protein C0J52_08329 [Blattella germanica]